jgi:hypothetical protein
MNVIGAGVRLLFCEGLPSSLDSRVLNRMLTGRTGVLVIPVGGKYGLRAFIDGYISSAPSTQQFIAFRDRDFDAEPPHASALIRFPGSKPIFLSHRACIENYLLEPATLDDYWNQNSGSPGWKHGPSPGISDLTSWVDGAAKQIAIYQAIRWALSTLKQWDRWPEVRTCWTAGSGHLPTSVDETDCLAKVDDMVSVFAAETQKVTIPMFMNAYQTFSARFAAANFWAGRDYTLWFHGKDLMSSMARMRQNSISLTHFCQWAADHFGWSAYTDLQEILSRV